MADQDRNQERNPPDPGGDLHPALAGVVDSGSAEQTGVEIKSQMDQDEEYSV